MNILMDTYVINLKSTLDLILPELKQFLIGSNLRKGKGLKGHLHFKNHSDNYRII